ncbi:MAG: LamG-like jellyroll fold domain-containing protein [Verrucomicrobiaceae bacterium]
MKRNSCAFALILACNSLVIAAPTVHWKLDEGTGTVASDSSGNAIDGTWAGTVGSPGWTPTEGIDGGSLMLTGENADTFINDAFSAVTVTPFTLSTWVKTTTTAKKGIVYLGDGTTGNQYYLINIQGGTARTTARNGTERAVAGAVINDGEWHNVVSVYASPTERHIYVDGVWGGTQTVEVLEFALNRFGIGGLTRNTPHAPVDLLAGQIDDVALWDRAFSAADAAALNALGALGAGNAADVELLVDAFTGQTTTTIRGIDWEYATGLTGSLGASGGSLGSRTGFVVMDDLGNGMKMSTIPGNPVVTSFTVTPEVIFLGETVTFGWDVDNATSVNIDQGVGAVANPSGTLEFSPTETATFTLTATNGNGSSFGEVNVTVIPEPVIDRFEATPTAIFVGEPVELAWDVQNFNTLEIDQEVGVVSGPGGTVTVSPTETTTYTFTATNDTTSSTAEVTIRVFPTPPPRELLLHWPLDEGEGTTTADLAGTNPGVFLETGGSPVWSEGFLGGGALTFQNQNDVSVRAVATLVEGYPFSMAGWVKTTASANDTWAVLGTGQNGNYYSMRVNNGAARIMTRNGGFFEQGGPGINDDAWHSMVAVYAHPASMSLYVDGVFVGTRTSDSGDFVTPDRFAIGALDRTDASVVDAFDGSVDDVSFWRGLLSDRDVAALHGGASGLGLNASDMAAILTGFENQETVNAAGLNWGPAAGLVGVVGETNGTLTDTPSIVLDDSGNGMVGSSTSGILITDITRNATGTTLTWNSVPGATYIVQFSTDLIDWGDEVDDGVSSGGATTTFTDSDPQRLSLPVGFYRVVR